MVKKTTTGCACLLLLLTSLQGTSAAEEEFTGTDSCTACHSEQYQSWKGSHHDLAMQHTNKDTILGDFDNAEFSANGITSRFFTKDGKFWINTDGPDGSMQDFEIRYVFGVTPLQQYLVEFPDGRIQALGIAWDTRRADAGGQRWFHLYPGQAISFEHELHWTRPQQNWNFMCAGCHSTNLVKGYDSASDTFSTSWSDIDVGCESCHGPGKQHLVWAKSSDELKSKDLDMGLAFLLRDRKYISWTMNPETGTATRSQSATDNREISLCAACHSRRGILQTGIESDPSFLDHYRPALLTGALYHADGQILDEVYVWGSFVQSKMYAAGVSCSDCHEPHSLDLRAEQDRVCARCHLPSKFASTQHHRHPPGSKGSNCLDCHMPETTYMVVDPRRDHSIRIPRPDFSLDLSTPNACNLCHTDQSTQWASGHFKEMWPNAADPFQGWGKAIGLARSGAPQAEIALISVITDQQTPDIARATAISELSPFLSPISGEVLQTALTDRSPLVRHASLGALEALPPENRYPFAARLLSDPVLAVRIEAARVSAPALRTKISPPERAVLQSALREFIDSQNLNADRSESHLNLGNLYSQTGNGVEAEKSYRRAIRLDPKFGPAYANLADLYRTQDMDHVAGKVLANGITELPRDATLHHALGLMHARNQQMDLALESLQKAAELQPGTARYTYVFGVALNSAGKPVQALDVLQKGHLVNPRDRETIFMLASINRDIERYDEARKWAQKLVASNPADQNAAQLIEMIDAAEGAKQ